MRVCQFWLLILPADPGHRYRDPKQPYRHRCRVPDTAGNRLRGRIHRFFLPRLALRTGRGDHFPRPETDPALQAASVLLPALLLVQIATPGIIRLLFGPGKALSRMESVRLCKFPSTAHHRMWSPPPSQVATRGRHSRTRLRPGTGKRMESPIFTVGSRLLRKAFQ